jgi:hypothetical protein
VRASLTVLHHHEGALQDIGKNVKAPRTLCDLLKDDMKEDAGKAAELGSLEFERETAAYESVADYEPVLRAHCRL